MKNGEERRMSATLDQALMNEPLAVLRINPPAAAPEWERWLEEIGFVPGEQVSLMARAMPGGDPLVVRVGQSTFALRCAEAACVEVLPVDSREVARLGETVLKGVQA